MQCKGKMIFFDLYIWEGFVCCIADSMHSKAKRKERKLTERRGRKFIAGLIVFSNPLIAFIM